MVSAKDMKPRCRPDTRISCPGDSSEFEKSAGCLPESNAHADWLRQNMRVLSKVRPYIVRHSLLTTATEIE